jgi:predicted ester cyclase
MRHLEHKKQVWTWLHALTRDSLEEMLHPEVQLFASHPINTLVGVKAVQTSWLEPLQRALPDFDRRDDIFVASETQTGDLVAAHGHYVGTFSQDLFGIPANQAAVRLRYGEFYQLEAGKITRAYILLDLLDLMRQVGVSPLLGASAEGLVQAPHTRDGVQFEIADPQASQQSRDLVFAMGAGLGQYDQKSLASMGMNRFWTPKMMWYGPSGIGTTRGLTGFEQYHQIPFLQAFPDRSGSFPIVKRFGRIADGHYVASGGYPSLGATHLGNYLGTPATGRSIGMRVMDFWRRENNLLAENWVLIDLPDLFLQFGVDLFAHLEGKHV